MLYLKTILYNFSFLDFKFPKFIITVLTYLKCLGKNLCVGTQWHNEHYYLIFCRSIYKWILYSNKKKSGYFPIRTLIIFKTQGEIMEHLQKGQSIVHMFVVCKNVKNAIYYPCKWCKMLLIPSLLINTWYISMYLIHLTYILDILDLYNIFDTLDIYLV